MPGQHQVEQPRRQHAAHAQTEPHPEQEFFPWVRWGAVSAALDLESFRPTPPATFNFAGVKIR